MHPDRHQDVLDKQQVSLVGVPSAGNSKLPRPEIVTSLMPAPG
jgi:hypothetical protein